MEGHSAPWGASDLVAATTAVGYAVLGVSLKAANRTPERIGLLLGTGVSLGPLLMIAADPFAQMIGIEGHLLDRVVSEARAILWWASAVAIVSLAKEIF